MRHIHSLVLILVSLSILSLYLPVEASSNLFDYGNVYENIVVLNATYMGILQVKSEGNVTSDVFTESVQNQAKSLSLFIHYRVDVEMFFNTYSMSIEKCNLKLIAMDISVDPPYLVSEIRSELNSYGDIMISNCTIPPIVLIYINGSIQLAQPKINGTATAFTRLDVDMLQIMGSSYEVSPGSINYSSWSVYIEPLTNIPVLYSEVKSARPSQGSYYYMVISVYLSDHRHVFEQIVSRDTFDLIMGIRISNDGSIAERKLTFVLLHLVKSMTNNTSQSDNLFRLRILGNDTLLLIYDKEVPCYVMIGPLDPDLSIKDSNVILATYFTFNDKKIYYTPSVLICRVLRFTLPGDIVNVEPPLTIEKSVPPRPYYPLMPENIMLTVITIFGTMYILYSIISKLVNALIIKKYS